MNWYKKIKISQTYQEVMDDPIEYSDPDDPEHFNSQRYFSIGQNDDQNYGYCWIFDGRRLRVMKGGTHSLNFPDLFPWKNRQNFNGYRGWYDPEQKLVSVVEPRETGQVDPALEPESLPTKLRVALGDEFGTNNKLVVF